MYNKATQKLTLHSELESDTDSSSETYCANNVSLAFLDDVDELVNRSTFSVIYFVFVCFRKMSSHAFVNRSITRPIQEDHSQRLRVFRFHVVFLRKAMILHLQLQI